MSFFRIWQQVPVVAIHSAIIRRYFATRTKTIRRFTVCLCLNSLEVGGNYGSRRQPCAAPNVPTMAPYRRHSSTTDPYLDLRSAAQAARLPQRLHALGDGCR